MTCRSSTLKSRCAASFIPTGSCAPVISRISKPPGLWIWGSPDAWKPPPQRHRRPGDRHFGRPAREEMGRKRAQGRRKPGGQNLQNRPVGQIFGRRLLPAQRKRPAPHRRRRPLAQRPDGQGGCGESVEKVAILNNSRYFRSKIKGVLHV